MSQGRRIARQDRPPTLGKVHHVVKVLSSARIPFTILSESLAGYWTHWNGQCTEPCFGDKKGCQACTKGLPKRWKGFLFVLNRETRSMGFLELTPLAAERLLNRMPDGQSMRGTRIDVYRERPGKKSPMVVEVVGIVSPDEELPSSADPDNTVKRLWGATNLS